MIFCTQCGARVEDVHQFCGYCGTRTGIVEPVPVAQVYHGAHAPLRSQSASPRHFAQVFGLDPRVAVLTLVVDMMLNAGDLVTMGMLLPVSIVAGIVLGQIVYRAQIKWYGDDKESACIKALALGLLTAIPTPLPELLYIPAGLVGLWHGFRRKESRGLNTRA